MNEEISVRGVAMWAPGYNDLESWLDGRRDDSIEAPSSRLLSVRARGRASLLTRMFAEVIQKALIETGTDPGAVPLICASAFGEIQITGQLLEMMNTGNGALSPARFQNSVHNTAVGQISIATENRLYSTALSAGDDTLLAALLEAMAWLRIEGGETVVALADELPIPPFNSRLRFKPLAYALHLTADPSALNTYGRLVAVRMTENQPSVDLPPEMRDNPCAIGLPLLEAIAKRKSAIVPLSLTNDSGLCLEYEAKELRT
jgi:hypothetical protein